MFTFFFMWKIIWAQKNVSSITQTDMLWRMLLLVYTSLLHTKIYYTRWSQVHVFFQFIAYLGCLHEQEFTKLVLHEYKTATNMTEQFAALVAIAQLTLVKSMMMFLLTFVASCCMTLGKFPSPWLCFWNYSLHVGHVSISILCQYILCYKLCVICWWWGWI